MAQYCTSPGTKSEGRCCWEQDTHPERLLGYGAGVMYEGVLRVQRDKQSVFRDSIMGWLGLGGCLVQGCDKVYIVGTEWIRVMQGWEFCGAGAAWEKQGRSAGCARYPGIPPDCATLLPGWT